MSSDRVSEPLQALHHPIFKKFAPWQGFVEPGINVNFLGVRTRSWFSSPALLSPQKRTYVMPTLPEPSDEYLEWITILESVVAARGRFTMIELGAGWGRWLANAAAALRRLGNLPYLLIGVEAEPTHFAWMKTHLQDNDVDFNSCVLLQAAVAAQNGEVWFQTGHASEWYGQEIVELPEHLPSGYVDARAIRVRAIALNTIMNSLDKVDLIDLDVQGSELSVLAPAARQLDRKVKCLHIGTHKPEIEHGLRELFSDLQWESVYSFPAGSEQETPWGMIRFGDGVQTWVNPKLQHS